MKDGLLALAADSYAKLQARRTRAAETKKRLAETLARNPGRVIHSGLPWPGREADFQAAAEFFCVQLGIKAAAILVAFSRTLPAGWLGSCHLGTKEIHLKAGLPFDVAVRVLAHELAHFSDVERGYAKTPENKTLLREQILFERWRDRHGS